MLPLNARSNPDYSARHEPSKPLYCPALVPREADRRQTALVVALGIALWAPRLVLQFAPPAPYDEGNTVVAAWRVLEGERLYRDVWQMHPPGTAWSLALAFRLLGTTLFTERLVKAALAGIALGLLHRFARRMAGPWLAASAVVAGALLPPATPFLRPNDPAFVASLAASALVLARDRLGRWGSPAIGALLGLTAAYRLDFGAGSALAIAAFLVARGEARRLLAVIPGAAIAPAAGAAALLLQGVAGSAWEQMFVFPATAYPAQRGMPLYDPAVVLLPLALCGAALLAAWAGRRHDRVRHEALLLTGCLGLGYLGYALVRPDLEHTLPARVLGLLAGTGLVSAAKGIVPVTSRRLLQAVAVAASCGVVAPALPTLVETARLGLMLLRPVAREPQWARAGPLLRVDTDAAAMARLVAERTRPGERIFVGNERHDRILVNHVLLYFLADRPSVTRYYNLHPGLATRADIQEEIVEAIERQAVRIVVLWSAPLWDEPNATARPAAGTLDAALRSHFEARETRGRYTLWERSSAGPGAVNTRTASGAR